MGRTAGVKLCLAGIACLALVGAAASTLAAGAPEQEPQATLRAGPQNAPIAYRLAGAPHYFDSSRLAERRRAPCAPAAGRAPLKTPRELKLAQAKDVAPAARAETKAPAKEDSDFRDAETAFPAFCQEWAAKLHRREADNLAHVHWREQNGYETGTYVAYSRIETCACKHSSKGMPVGKLFYHEEVFYLVGHSIEEAQHAKPKLVGTTGTLELFNWNHHHWQY
jgi:hypothetical protein